MKRSHKIFLITLATVFSSVALILLVGVIYISVFAKNNVNVENDERLFNSSKGETFTEYYISKNESVTTVDEYDPVLHESLALGEYKKKWTDLSAVNQNVIDAFISAEDRAFFSHSGVNIRRTLYAMANSVFHFKSTFGASTITQQVIKNISGDNEVTLKRKLAEIIRAYSIEKNHTKEEILELYLNIVPMGENIYGIRSAAEIYFGKSPKDLTLAEAATLAAITNAPTRYNPHTNYDNCIKKRNDVLYAMLDNGAINEYEYNSATGEPLSVLPFENVRDRVSSWFVETVNYDVTLALMRKYGLTEAAAELLLYRGGLKIYTTESPSVQKRLEEYFYNESNFPSAVCDGLQLSMVVSDSVTGDLLGIIGSVGEKRSNRILNYALVPHTPGSSLKPIALYAPLIDSGKINWATVFDDVPLKFTKNGSTYLEYPQNYPKVYDGLITLKDSLRLSKNTTAIRLYEMLGAENIYRSLKNDFHFDTLVRREITDNGGVLTDLAPSPLALGQLSYGVSLRKLTEAYTVFAREGMYSEGRSFIAVYDTDGDLLLDNSFDEVRVFSRECARIMNKLLMSVTDSGTASKVTLKKSVDTAGKTGTSGDDKDRLFIGYTPYYTAGIWCGYASGERSVGKIAPTHIRIWDEVMTSIHEDRLKSVPENEIKSFSSQGLIKAQYCKDSGKLYTDRCSCDPRGLRLDTGYFTRNTLPKGECDRHVLVAYDECGEGMATELCPEENIKVISLLRIEDRHFPKEIIVSDADYVYWQTDGTREICTDSTKPYYYNYTENGDFVGRGRKNKQFNSVCTEHQHIENDREDDISEAALRFMKRRRKSA